MSIFQFSEGKRNGHSTSMKRKFTLEEKIEVLKYWKENPNLNDDEVAAYFEKKFGIPVSSTGVAGVAIEEAMGSIKLD